MTISDQTLRNQAYCHYWCFQWNWLSDCHRMAAQKAQNRSQVSYEDAPRSTLSLTNKTAREVRQFMFVADGLEKKEDVNLHSRSALAEFSGFDNFANNAGVSIFGLCTEVSIHQ
ncbi:hypothetical protein AB0758_30830 [Tolypothrix bouteillei VB521301_2]|uniref:hypothetical protein n=1 Tax=Tolypothrix bouteillei TaxID=1246981 RepID=UPI0038B49D8A